jgi:photosynthetic reaction center H subunit
VPRKDEPELDGHGKLKIVPMAQTADVHVAAGRDPRGLPVQAGDLEVVGRISDLWVDVSEQVVRYLEVELNSGSRRLVPMPMAKIWADRVRINAITSDLFEGIPATKSLTHVTKLEEDKISAYVAGGWLYAKGRKRGF